MKLLTAIFKKKRFDFDLPETISELNWGQVTELIKIEPDDPDYLVKLVSIMTGIDAGEWRETTETAQFIELAISCQKMMNSWASEFADPEASKRNPTVTINGKTITFPDEIGHQSVGQYQDCIAMQSKWRRDNDEAETFDAAATFGLYENIFRIYAQPLVDGEYDYAKAMDLDISEVPYLDVIAWAYFFLISSRESKSGTKTNAHLHRTLMKRYRRVIPKFLRSSDF